MQTQSPTQPAAATVPAAAKTITPLTGEAFLTHMVNMQAHYSPGGNGMKPTARPFMLPAHIALLANLPKAAPRTGPAPHPTTVATATTPAAIVNLLNAEEQNTLAFVNGHHGSVVAALSAAKTANDTKSFVQQMHVLEQQELADHAARIKALFGKLIAAGQQHPHQQPHILLATNSIGGFLAGLLHDAHATTQGITGVFGSLAHVTQAAVHEATSAVGHWAAGAVKSVGSFFKSLF